MYATVSHELEAAAHSQHDSIVDKLDKQLHQGFQNDHIHRLLEALLALHHKVIHIQIHSRDIDIDCTCTVLL